MRSPNSGLGETQILFIYRTHEFSEKGRAERKDRFHWQGKGCSDCGPSPSPSPLRGASGHVRFRRHIHLYEHKLC